MAGRNVARSGMSADIRGARELTISVAAALAAVTLSCGGPEASAEAISPSSSVPEVAVVKAVRKNLHRNLVVSSELVPFQQIDVYAKESGFVQQLNVDYGTHVKAGQVIAVLEIPELRVQLEEDRADINDAAEQVIRYRKELDRVEAQQNAVHLQYTRLDSVAKNRPGLVAQQEIDDWQSKDMAAAAQSEAARAALNAAQSQLAHAKAKLLRDQVIYDYSKITALFDGVVTKRYANQGTLVQAATNSSTSVLPIVQLSEDDRFRLVIPVPESYVRFIRKGDAVQVRVPSLKRTFPGSVSRFSVDVEADTRTMHTEVDVPNPDRVLMPGLYAEATITLERRDGALAVPPEAVVAQGDRSTVWVVGPSGDMHMREISVGIETAEDIEVLSGVNEGDLVAVGDRSGLKNGETVRPKQVALLQYHGE